MPKKGIQIHGVFSFPAADILDAQKLCFRELESAMDKWEETNSRSFTEMLGINEQGVFGDTEEGLVIVPWVQVQELLGRVPEGTTQGFVSSRAN